MVNGWAGDRKNFSVHSFVLRALLWLKNILTERRKEKGNAIDSRPRKNLSNTELTLIAKLNACIHLHGIGKRGQPGRPCYRSCFLVHH